MYRARRTCHRIRPVAHNGPRNPEENTLDIVHESFWTQPTMNKARESLRRLLAAVTRKHELRAPRSIDRYANNPSNEACIRPETEDTIKEHNVESSYR